MSSSPLRCSTHRMKPTKKGLAKIKKANPHHDFKSAQPIGTDDPPSANSLNTDLTIKGNNLPSSTFSALYDLYKNQLCL